MAEVERLLVIGGTGFIGHHFLRAAVRQNWKVCSLSLHPAQPKRHVAEVEYLAANLLDFEEIHSRLRQRDFEYVVNFGGYINHSLFSRGGRQLVEEHFTGVQNLIEVLPRNCLRAFVQIGSSDEYGDAPAPQSEDLRESPISPYSLGKVATTHFLQMLHRTESFPSVVLRLFLTYGPGQDHKRFLPQVIRGCLNDENFPASTGEQVRDFCYVEDVIQAILLALENDSTRGKVFNIASGEKVTIRKMIETIQQLIGGGKPEFGKIPYRASENMCLYADTTKANQIMGWSPQFPLELGLEHTINWYRENG